MKKKLISKKKLIGTIASTAVLAAPLVLAPSQYSYATPIGTPPPVNLDKIHTIVLPKNGVKYFDFQALYQAENIHITTSGSENVKAGFSFWDEGIYEVRALDIGDATFTVSGIGHSDEQEGYVNFTDTFKVIVVANTANPDAYKFDIVKAFDLLIQPTQSKDNTIAILQNIAPETVENTEPFSYNTDNTPPYPIIPTSPSVLQAEVGVPIDSWSIKYQIGSYFSDDYSILCYGEEEGEEEGEEGGEFTRSCLSLVSVESNASINVTPIYEGEALVDQEVVPVTEGTAYLDVVVTDHEGGFTKGHIPIHVNPYVAAPQFKPTSVVGNHFRMPDVSPTLYLSNDAEIDLNEIFYSEGDLDYSVSVEYGLYTPHTATLYLDNDASQITWTKLNELLTQQMDTQDTVRNIRGITAEISGKETNLDVYIQHTTIDPFPATIDMYQSNSAGTSSYTLNYKSDKGFNGNKMLVNLSDIQNNNPTSVTAYVYQNDNLKFDFANEINPNISKVKVYAHDSIPGNLYLDDFNFRLVSPALTPLANSNIPTVHIKRLYPEVSDTYWENRAGELGSFITSERIQDVFLEYWKDQPTQVVTVTGVFRYEAAQGSQVLLNIDPFNGAKVFQVPFIKPYVQP
ncbi:hypothetical protein [Paenibacillus qinlingensis]|uniref:hypothetical protein n=1 Tax=Paenibacillus qinlingensis TaxID=1837343 RepID=UPI001564D6E9|nr:hypothetical protein [Paenibacillus qinlingensis]NQX61564.1 hypothetical protein [Paenibacillus qinlingensis]